MDTKNRNRIDGDQKDVNNKGAGAGAGTGKGNENGNGNGNSSPTATAGTGAVAGAGAGAAEKIPAEKIPGLPVIDIPIPAEPKKKSSSKSKKDDLDKTLEGNIRLLIGTGFGFAAKILKSEIWEVSDEEAASISTPLTKILQRLGINESMNKYADYIALTTALTVVTVPRVLIYKAMKDQEQLDQEGGQANNGKAKKAKTAAAKSSSTSHAAATTLHTTNIKAVLDVSQ